MTFDPRIAQSSKTQNRNTGEILYLQSLNSVVVILNIFINQEIR